MDGILGEGGMAIVYRARDMRRPRAVAIKVLRVEIAQLIGTTRFLREIAVTSAFSHPNILPLIDSGEITDEQGRTTPFYVMPLVEGETLHERMVRSGRLPIADLLRITREILEALQYAHSKGVIHRDIKPANILLSNGHAVVADFGVARPLSLRNAVASNEPDLTLVGEIVGTPTYMSPEQANGSQVVDARSDLFSVGCVLYEMAVGVRPFDTPIPQLTHARKAQGIYLPTSNHRPEIPAALDAILEKALKPDPAERFASAYEFIEALSHVTVDSKPAPTQRSIRTKRMVSWGFAATLLLASAAAATPYAMRRFRAASAPTVVPGSDLARVAVLPLEEIGSDSVLRTAASGFHTDLIDELAQFPALTVISKNGVMRFQGNAASSDSIARALNVGSLVTGNIRRFGDSVLVTIRLVDGATGVVRSTADVPGSAHDLLAVRSSVLSSVTTFLREAIGREIGEAEKQSVRVAEAWELTARAREMVSDQELTRIAETRPGQQQSVYRTADSLLMRAARVDRGWSGPLVVSASSLLSEANFVEAMPAARRRGGEPLAPISPNELRKLAVERATQALERNPNDANAYHQRGKARFEIWRTSRPIVSDSMRTLAEEDLRKAVAHRRDLALAQSDLSTLLQYTGDYSGSRDAAEQALKADAFLNNAPNVLNRLFFTSLATGRVEQATRLCDTGRQRYPKRPEFWGCDLTVIGWTGKSASDVETAWRKLEAAETADSLRLLASGYATRRLLVAAIAARAGLKDSAEAIIRRVRDALPIGESSPNADYGEAYVRVLLGQTDQALPLLRAYIEANPALRGQVRKTPWFEALRNNQEFLAMTAPQ